MGFFHLQLVSGGITTFESVRIPYSFSHHQITGRRAPSQSHCFRVFCNPSAIEDEEHDWADWDPDSPDPQADTNEVQVPVSGETPHIHADDYESSDETVQDHHHQETTSLLR